MSEQANKAQSATQRRRGWLIPLGIVMIAAVLVVMVVLQQTDRNEAPAGSAGESTGETVEGITVVPTDAPDLTQFEARNPADVQAAGPIDAPVGMVIFSDYQCKYCAKFTHDTLPAIMKYAESGDLRIEWRDVNMYGEPSRQGSLAAHAAGLQGRYWEFHDALYPAGAPRPATELTGEFLVNLAGEMGFDTEKFAADMANPEVNAQIDEIAALGRQLGVTGTPSFLLGGRALVGAQPTESFIDAIETALAAAQK